MENLKLAFTETGPIPNEQCALKDAVLLAFHTGNHDAAAIVANAEVFFQFLTNPAGNGGAPMAAAPDQTAAPAQDPSVAAQQQAEVDAQAQQAAQEQAQQAPQTVQVDPNTGQQIDPSTGQPVQQ